MARGRVFRHGAGWAIRYDAGLDPETGQRKQPFKSGFKTEQDADKALVVALAEVASNQHVLPVRTTFADVVRSWLDAVAVRDTSHERYSGEAARYLIPALGRHPIQQLTPAHIRAAYKRWAAQGLSAGTIRTLHSRIAGVLKIAVQDRLLVRNPLDAVEPPPLPATELQIWTKAELTIFLEEVPNLGGHGPLWHTAAMTGMRRGELLGLRWKDVDLDAGIGVIRVRQQALLERGAIRLRELKTPRSSRTISLDPGTVAILRQHKTAVAVAKLAAAAWSEHGLVFPRLALHGGAPDVLPGGPQVPNAVTMRWKVVVQRLPLPAIRLHDLRHTHASHLLAAGWPVHIVAARLGHSPSILLQTYAHVIPNDQDALVNWLDLAYKRG